MSDKPYSATSLAKRWGVSRQHIHNMIASETIKNTFKLGNLVRVPAWEVERIEQCGNLYSSEESITPTPKLKENQLGDLYVPPMNH